MTSKIIYLIVASLSLIACEPKNKPMKEELALIIGTYTDGESKGIYTYRFNQKSAENTPLSSIESSNPSYLTLSTDNKFVYAVSEHNDGQEEVKAFAFDIEQGTMQFINSQAAMGADPCYITTNGKYVVTANYSSGNIATFPIQTDGFLLPASDVINFVGSGLDKTRQESAHLHCVQFSPDGKFLFACDLGTDRIYKFNVETLADAQNQAKLLEIGTPPACKVTPGSGPRHLIFAPNGKHVYLINELSGKVTAFRYSNNGYLTEVQEIPSDSVGARGSADIHISPDGKFLYASNRLKADGIAIFSINPKDGKLSEIGYQPTGIHPRNFVLTPNGSYLLVACRDSNVVEIYKRDKKSGLLKDTNKRIEISRPVCLKFEHVELNQK